MSILGCLGRLTSGRYALEGTDVPKHHKNALALIGNDQDWICLPGFNLLSRTTALQKDGATHSVRGDRYSTPKTCRLCIDNGWSGRAGAAFPVANVGQTATAGGHCSALVNRPSILPADEPTGNLVTVLQSKSWRSSRPERQGANDRAGDSRTRHLRSLSVCTSSGMAKSARTIRT
jgi:putative ABC transport system ATP-binding protein